MADANRKQENAIILISIWCRGIQAAGDAIWSKQMTFYATKFSKKQCNPVDFRDKLNKLNMSSRQDKDQLNFWVIYRQT
jgi:hypothetical protein